MTSENYLERLGIDMEAWRQEIRVFAEETQQTLNAIGDMLLSGNSEIDNPDSFDGESHVSSESDTEVQDIPEGGGRLDQLRAKLAQKISEKNN